MKNIIQPIVLTAALLVLTASAFASNVKGGGEVTVSTPVEGNLYVGAGKVYINAPVSGDLVAGCGEISVKDSVMCLFGQYIRQHHFRRKGGLTGRAFAQHRHPSVANHIEQPT